jgi:hypothetical protein
MRIKLGPTILFFIIYIWAYAIFNAVNAKADEPTITIPYTEEQMCKALLRAEICDMSQAEQEQYFLEMFKALIEQKLNEEKEIESMEICFKETEQGKLIPCEGMDI